MTLIAVLLTAEGLSTGLWIAKLVPRLGGYDRIVVALLVLRGLVGGLQLAGAACLVGRRPAGVRLSRWALLASAALTTLEIGARLAPGYVAPGLRWPLVAAYWIYAVGAASYLSSRDAA